RRIAAADMATREALPQVHPATPGREALGAALQGPRVDGRDLAQVGTRGHRSVILVVEPGQPGREAVDGLRDPRVLVDVVVQPGGDPPHGEGLAAAPLDQFLKTAIGEVHAVVTPSAVPRWPAPQASPAVPRRAAPSARPRAAWPSRP